MTLKINETFQTDLGAFVSTNGTYGITSVSGNGHVNRSDVSPYAEPAVNYIDCGADFTAFVNLRSPTSVTANYSFRLIYRYQDTTNYRYLKAEFNSIGELNFIHSACIAGVHTDYGNTVGFGSWTPFDNFNIRFLVRGTKAVELCVDNLTQGFIETAYDFTIGSEFLTATNVGFSFDSADYYYTINASESDVISNSMLLNDFTAYDSLIYVHDNKYSYIDVRGLEVAGSATALIIGPAIVASGGAKAGGTSLLKKTSTATATGGVAAGGSSVSRILIFAKGGVKAGGSASVSLGFCAKGGLRTRGLSAVSFIDYVNGTGGVKAGTSAGVSANKFYRRTASGGITISGGYKYSIPTRRYNPRGGITMGGTGSPNIKFQLDLAFKWNTRARISKDITFLWNTGRLLNYWYRIIAKDNCHDPCCQKYIINIHARSLSELCDKLTKRRYKFTIDSAQRFSMPADNSEIKALEAEGQTFDDCNTFVDIPLCEVPRCEQFCIDYDLSVDVQFDIIYTQVNAFFGYESTGGVFITGNANSTSVRFVPDFPYQASGGIVMGGEARNKGTGYSIEADSSGGIIMGGTSPIRSSSWHFIGGNWPSTSRVRIGESTESLLENTGDQNWSLTDRVLVDDGLFASTDISYGRTSHFLIVRGFDFNIPVDSDIIHIYVKVQRKSNQAGVRDVEAYILNGDEIISENEAKTGVDWPVSFESQTTYDFTDDFDIVDLNSFEVGFALRVNATVPLSATIAYVDFITVEVIYESEQNQRIRMAGSAGIVSSAYSWVASGGIAMGGTCGTKAGMKYKSNGKFVVIGGEYGLNLSYEGSGGIVIQGSAEARPSFQQIDVLGGVRVGGTADAKPYFEFGSGGVVAGKSAIVQLKYKEFGASGVVVGGISPFPAATFSVVGDGGITMAGVASRRTNSWSHHSDGNVVFILGGADYTASDFGTLMEEPEFIMTVDDMFVEFNNDSEIPDAKNLTSFLIRCGCGDIPLTLNLEHGIARNNNFSQFLKRNSLTISNRLKMQYNARNDSWQTNLHYRGLSTDANTEESWDVVFDVQCTENLGSIFIGRQIWKIAMEVVRRNLVTGVKFDTRVVVGILPDQICAANELNFKTTINTQTYLTEIVPDATIYQSVLHDDIGLFKNTAWRINPSLIFTVSQVGLDSVQKRIDVTSDVLVS